MAEDFEVTGEWTGNPGEAQVYTAKAITRKNRVLATVTTSISIETAYDFYKKWGDVGRQDIEKSTDEIANGIGERMTKDEEPPSA